MKSLATIVLLLLLLIICKAQEPCKLKVSTSLTAAISYNSMMLAVIITCFLAVLSLRPNVTQLEVEPHQQQWVSLTHCCENYEEWVEVTLDGDSNRFAQIIPIEHYADYATATTQGYAIAHDNATTIDGEDCKEILVRLLNTGDWDYQKLHIEFVLIPPRHTPPRHTPSSPKRIGLTVTILQQISITATASTTTIAATTTAAGGIAPSSTIPAMADLCSLTPRIAAAEMTIREQKNALILVSSLLGAAVVLIIASALVIVTIQQRRLRMVQ